VIPIAEAVQPADLVAVKRALPLSVSVCLPARDEAPTIGGIVREIRGALVSIDGGDGLVDEVVVIDDGSTDPTAAIARAAGATVVAEADVLPDAGPGSGKGNALWKSLYACRGDVICWIDADLANFRADSVVKLLEPLLLDPDTLLVKASYARSFEGADRRRRHRAGRPPARVVAVPEARRHRAPLGGE
jgi:glucosyl-3-phosphoglycerate synthase